MQHKVVSHKEWLEARKRHLADEKEFTKQRDRLSQARRDLPWERVEKDYEFEGPNGRASLSELFGDRGQLVIYHAMFNPDTASGSTSWTRDAPCFVCSFWLDNLNGVAVHLNHRDVTVAGVVRALREARGVREAHGLGIPVVLVAGVRLQLRLPRVVHS